MPVVQPVLETVTNTYKIYDQREREKAIVHLTNIETVRKATMEKLLREGVERIWAFASA